MGSLLNAFMARQKLRQHATDDMRSFHSQLRRGLRSFTDDIDELIPYFEKVIYKFVKLQVIYTGQALANHWKKV